MKAAHKPHAEKDNWRAPDRNQEDDDDLDDWKADTGKSFFVIKQLPMSARQKSTPQFIESDDPRWAGRPNFKKFRPVRRSLKQLFLKCLQKNEQRAAAQPQRRIVELVIAEHGTESPEVQHPDDLESDSDEEMLPNFNKTGRQAPKPKATKAKERKKSDSVEPRASRGKGKKKESAYIEISDSEEDELADDQDEAEVSDASVRTSSTIGKRVAKRTTAASKSKGKKKAWVSSLCFRWYIKFATSASDDHSDDNGMTFKVSFLPFQLRINSIFIIRDSVRKRLPANASASSIVK